MIDKEKKEFAERLRGMVTRTDMIVAETRESHPPMLSVDPREVLALADKYDPPNPEPKTAVWQVHFTCDELPMDVLYLTRKAAEYFVLRNGYDLQDANIARMTIPARIAGPMQEIVDIPAVKDWPIDADSLSLRYSWPNDPSDYANVTITRSEAERMEANQ